MRNEINGINIFWHLEACCSYIRGANYSGHRYYKKHELFNCSLNIDYSLILANSEPLTYSYRTVKFMN